MNVPKKYPKPGAADLRFTFLRGSDSPLPIKKDLQKFLLQVFFIFYRIVSDYFLK